MKMEAMVVVVVRMAMEMAAAIDENGDDGWGDDGWGDEDGNGHLSMCCLVEGFLLLYIVQTAGRGFRYAYVANKPRIPSRKLSRMMSRSRWHVVRASDARIAHRLLFWKLLCAPDWMAMILGPNIFHIWLDISVKNVHSWRKKRNNYNHLHLLVINRHIDVII